MELILVNCYQNCLLWRTIELSQSTEIRTFNFNYYKIYKCTLFQSYCTNMYCCQLWFNSTKSSLIKLSTSYNSVLRRLLCISKQYSASNMFVSRAIPSFAELLRKSIYRFKNRIELSSNSIITACLSPLIYISSLFVSGGALFFI